MDGERFDTLARLLSATRSRRGALGALLTLLAGALGLHGRAAGAAATGMQRRHAQGEARKRRGKGKSKKKGGNASSRPTTVVTPPPVPVLAYQCPGPREDTIVSGGGSSRIAQTFTAARRGSLSQIQIEITKKPGTTGDYVVELLDFGADGKPTNTVLATATIRDASVPDGDSTLRATFSGPPLVAGTEYAAAISRPGGSELQVGDRIGNDCAGTAFIQNPIGTGSFEPLFAGTRDLVTAVTVLA